MPATLLAPPQVFRGEWEIEDFPITAGQTFKPGDFVYLVSGAISICAAPSNDVGNIAPMGIVGGDAAQLLAYTNTVFDVPVHMPAGKNHRFLLPVYHSTAASAVIAATDLPITLPLRNQGGIWCVNKETNGTNDRIIVLARHEEYPFSETYGWFWCAFKDGVQYQETA